MSGSWQIFSVLPDRSNLSQLTHAIQDAHYPASSPDGSKIAYVNNEGEILIMELGKEPQRIPNLPKNCNHPAWAPKGGKLALVCYSFRDRREESDIWIADLEEGRVQRLLEQEGLQSYPAWSPDGLTIAYTTGYRIGSDKIVEELWLVGIDGRNPKPLVLDSFSNIHPDWSPDGEKIAFASNRAGNMDIWVIDKSGRNMRQLTYEKSYDADPSWSPDGSKICFTSIRNGKLDIWVIECDGGNPSQLTGLTDSQGESKEPKWSR
jgi:Tol biopolymer transport system component